MGITYDAVNGVDTDVDYKFWEKALFLNSYLVCKLNTDLHSKTFGLDSKNGFELYRLICQLIDAIPDNAKFHLIINDLGNLSPLGPQHPVRQTKRRSS